MKKSALPRKLTIKDEEILGRVARYGIITSDLLERLYFSRGTKQGMRSLLGRLADREGNKFLKVRDFKDGGFWYQLTPLGCEILGEDSELAKEFSLRELMLHYGALIYCFSGKRRKRLYTRKEFVGDFPELGDAFDKYCLGTFKGEPKLTCIRVAITNADVPRICREFEEKARAVPALSEIMEAKRFAIAVVTPESYSVRQEFLSTGLKVELKVKSAFELPTVLAAFQNVQQALRFR